MAAGLWLATAGLAWAQPPGAKPPGGAEEKGGTTYLLPYAVVILAIALGVFILLNSSRRRDRAKPEVYGKGK
jgi:SNF family Na+-dependent transporter